jgi:hypothetical protein
MTLLVGGCAVTSSGMAWLQKCLMNRKIEATQLTEPPVFVIGHWRSGTTLLHEMLCLDEQFAWPSTFECFVPAFHHIGKPLLQPLIRMLMPSRRPMDSMPAGPELPQEDEFALVGMGAPTPYYRIAFCREDPPFVEMLNLKNASADQISELRDALTWFYKSVTFGRQKRLVLKSPTHTGRIGHLARWFPGARFVHITRHPHKVFPSTIHLWKSLDSVQGYQLPADDHRMMQMVNQWYCEMYDGYFEQVGEIESQNIVQVRFEDLIDNPLAEIESIYQTFGLNGFDQMKPRLEAFWSQRSSHRSNKTRLTEETRKLIDHHWSRYMEAFGYQPAPQRAEFGKVG